MPTPDLPDSIPAEIAAWLYDPTGQTLIRRLDNADGIAATMRVSLTGTCSWRIPLADSAVADMVDESIVKLSIRGAIRTAHRLAQGVVDHVPGDGTKWLVFNDQPDLIDVLDDAALGPEYGLRRASGSDRNFGYMSAPGDWLTDDWVDCLGDPRDGGIRDYPDELLADNPEFIGVDPTALVSTFAEHYYRSKPGVFTLSAATWVEIAACFDNYGTFYLDGEQVLSSDRNDPSSYRHVQTVRRYVEAGGHQLASFVQNDFQLVGTTYLAMAVVIYETDESGNHTGTILLKTQAADWIANDGTTPPGYRRAHVLVKAFDEDVADGCTGPTLLTRTFDWINDSNGNPWSATAEVPGTYTFAVNSKPSAMIQTLTEQDLDVWVDAATMTYNAVPHMGADRRADVAWTVDPETGTLKSLQSTRTAPTFTVVRAQLADRWLEEVASGATVRKVTGMSLGLIGTEAAARAAMQAQLAIYAHEVVSVEAEGVSVAGDQIFVDCWLGDTVSITDHMEDGTMPVRLLAISFDGSAIPARIWPANLTKVGAAVPRHPPATPEEALQKIVRGFLSGATGGRSSQSRPVATQAPVGAQALFATVSHGTDGTVSRPTARTVYWKGSATPANALPNDFWYAADA